MTSERAPKPSPADRFALLADALRRDLQEIGVALNHVDENKAGAVYSVHEPGLTVSWDVNTRPLKNRDLPVFAQLEPDSLPVMTMSPLADPMTQGLAAVLTRMGYALRLELDMFGALVIIVTGMSD